MGWSGEQLDRNSRGNSEIPFIPFPEDPNFIELDGQKVIDYISPEVISTRIKTISGLVNLVDFDSVVVNAKGGWFLYHKLARLQNFGGQPVEVAYHRPQESYGAIVVKQIPEELKNSRLLMIEDILDTGGVLDAMMKDAPNSTAVVAVRKRNIPSQIQTPNTFVAVETENYWLGGFGMDFGVDGYPTDFPRNYPGIVVMPESL
ncbi:MAG: hypothetical protein ACC618_04395 [Patescibacteria group bacterium]